MSDSEEDGGGPHANGGPRGAAQDPLARPHSVPPTPVSHGPAPPFRALPANDAGLLISTVSPPPAAPPAEAYAPPKSAHAAHGHELLVALLTSADIEGNVTRRSAGRPHAEVSRATFADEEMVNYLDHLTGSSLAQLRTESEALAEQALHIQEELARLAYTDYKTFLDSHAATASLRSSFHSAAEGLDKAVAVLPELEAASADFVRQASAVLAERARTSLVLSHHATLLDVLEIPQLIDTFVRNGYYEEAMDLKNHAARLVVRYPGVALLQRIAAEAEQCGAMMLGQLVNLLRGDVKLPVCIRVIGYLRRLEAYTEHELRVMFLRQRDGFFRAQLPAPAGDPADYLKRYIDSSREHFFDIITQYRAIFSDGPASGLAPSAALDPDVGSNTVLSTLSILSSYVTGVLEDFVGQLEAHLPRVRDVPQLGSLLTQTMYYGMSLGRVGIDFRQCVGKRFERAVGDVVLAQMRAGCDAFVEYVARSGVEAVQPVKVSGGAGRGEASVYQAPAVLVAWPPLGNLVNYYFTAYNALRICAPLSQIRRLAKEGIEDGLVRAAEALRAVGSRLDPTSTHHAPLIANHRQCARLFAEVAVPAICDGFERGVYAGSVPSTGAVDRTRCAEPLAELLPRAGASPVAREGGAEAPAEEGRGSHSRLSVEQPRTSVDRPPAAPASEPAPRTSTEQAPRSSTEQPPRLSADRAGRESSEQGRARTAPGQPSADGGPRASTDSHGEGA
ncbi:Dor1-like family-domain-containing protein [Hyaloraphidium curvatum]|nr:Dor1-like family-domain-containing protein [Hyaloraphidium curvatum]